MLDVFIVVQVMSGSEFGRQLYKLMEMGELVPTVSTTSPYILPWCQVF